MDTHEVISAFLDDEPFDPVDLAAAVADPGGRQLLLDLVALRALVRDELRGTLDLSSDAGTRAEVRFPV